MSVLDQLLHRPTVRFCPVTLSGLCLPLLCIFCALAACRATDDSAESGPTIDVEPALDVPTENDLVEVRRHDTGLSGILPGDFPGDVPLLLPASLVDYGETDGAPYIELATSRARQTVEKGLVGLLQDRGWILVESSAEGTPDELLLIKDARPLRIVFRESSSGSLYRIVY